MKCSSRHTFAPIDSTFCTPRIYILASGALGKPTIGRSQRRGGQTPSSILVCAPSSQVSGGPTPSSLPTPSRMGPGMVPFGPGETQLPVCLLHTGVCTALVVGFSLTNKIPVYMGLTLNFQWSTLSPTSPFSATLSCCYCSC